MVFRLLVCLCLLSGSVFGQWKKQADGFGEIRPIIEQDGILYTTSQGTGLLVSEDGGATWKPRNGTYPTQLDPSASCVIIHNKAIWVGTQGGGLFRSTDSGKSWSSVKEFPFYHVGGIVSQGKRLIVGRGNAATSSPVLYRSDDDGRTWQSFGYSNYDGVQFLSIAGDTLYTAAASDALRISYDAGTTWTVALQADVLFLSTIGKTIIAATRYSGIAISEDAGKSWRYEQPNNGQLTQFGSTLIANGNWYAGTLSGKVVYSNDKGRTWRDFSAGLPRAAVSALIQYKNKLLLGASQSFQGEIWGRSLLELAPDFLIAPTDLSIDGYARDQNVLAWKDNADNENGFIVERSEGTNQQFSEIGRIGRDTLLYNDNTVGQGKTYYYRVRAFNAQGISGYSNEVSYRKPVDFCQDQLTYQAQSLSNVHLLDAQRGFAVGYQEILKTTDGGKTWQKVNLGSLYYPSLHQIKFINAKEGYIFGENRFALRTTDGGETWSYWPVAKVRNDYIHEFSYADRYQDIVFPSSNIGYLLRLGTSYQSYSSILKTQDSGKSWEVLPLPGSSSDLVFRQLHFFDDSTGFFCGSDQGIFRTTTGGRTWELIDMKQYLDFAARPSFMYFIDRKTGFVHTSRQNLMKTVDGGLTWQRIIVGPLSGNVYKIMFANATTGYIVTSDGVLKTTDVGETWVKVDNFPNLTDGLTGGSIYQETLLFVGSPFASGFIGSGGRVIIRSGDSGKTFSSVSNNLSYRYTNISFPDAKTGYVAGCYYCPYNENSFYKTIDGGITWLKRDFPELINKEGFLKFWTASRGVYLPKPVTASQTIIPVYTTQNGGDTWSKTDLGTITSLSGIQFVTEKIWFFYSGLTLYQTTDGGQTVRAVGMLPDFPRVMAFGTNLVGYFWGLNGGEFYRTTDGGKSWQVVDLPKLSTDNTSPPSIQAFGDNICYVSGSYGQLVKTVDGGRTWQDQLPNFDGINVNSLYYIRLYFATAQMGYAKLGSDWYKTTNGGRSWHYTFGDSNTDDPGSVDYADTNRLYIAAQGGNIITVTPGTAPLPPQTLWSNTLCLPNNTAEATYYVTADNSKSFQWQLSGGGLLRVNRNQAKVVWQQEGDFVLSVKQSNACGVSSFAQHTIGVRKMPTKPTITHDGITLRSSAPTDNQWLQDGQLISGAVEATYTASKSGLYAVQVANECGAVRSDTLRIVITGLEDSTSSAVIYPNPATTVVNVYAEQLIDIQLSSLRGVFIRRETAINGKASLLLHDLSAGTYLLRLQTPRGITYRRLVIVP